MLAVLIEQLAIDDGKFDSLRRHNEPASAARQIVAHLRAPRRTDFLRIEYRDIGGEAFHQPPAIPDAEEIRRLCGEPLHAALQRERLLLAHPVPKEIGAISRVA